MEKETAAVSSSPHSQHRNRMTRNTRALTPDAQRIHRATKSSDRDVRTIAVVGGDVIQESKYVVRGVLNVGPPSPSGSTSSSNSNSGSGGERSSHMSSGSHAYRAKLLR